VRICVCVLPPGKTATGRIYPTDVRVAIVEQAGDKFLFSDMSGDLDKVIGFVTAARKAPDESVLVEFDVVDTPVGIFLAANLRDEKLVVRPVGRGREFNHTIVSSDYELAHFGVTEVAR